MYQFKSECVLPLEKVSLSSGNTGKETFLISHCQIEVCLVWFFSG